MIERFTVWDSEFRNFLMYEAFACPSILAPEELKARVVAIAENTNHKTLPVLHHSTKFKNSLLKIAFTY